MEVGDDLREVIETSLKKRDLDVLHSYLSSTIESGKSFCGGALLMLEKILKQKGKYEDKTLHVNCVLSCLDHFLDTNGRSDVWIQQADKISKMFVITFEISAIYMKSEMSVEKNINTISGIIEHSNIPADSVLRYMSESLFKTALSPALSNSVRLLILGLIGNLLQKSSRQKRTEILPSVTSYIEKLSNYLLACGDYETQVSIVEILARSWLYIENSKTVPVLFGECPHILQLFKKYNFLNFDSECRLFLNEVNNSLGENQLVYSIPCLVVYRGSTCLKKPIDPECKQFWIDFNIVTRSISFYFHSISECWELMTIKEENIIYATSKNSSCKAKDGVIVPVVKIEITMKPDLMNLTSSNSLKIYIRENKEIALLESTVIKKILQDKYKSEVVYRDSSLQRTNLKIKSATPSHHLLKSTEMAVVVASTSLEMQSPRHSQLPDDMKSLASDLGNSSGPQETIFSSLRSIGQIIKSPLICSEDLKKSKNHAKSSDSFSHFIQNLKEEKESKLVIDDTQNEDGHLNQTRDDTVITSNATHINKTIVDTKLVNRNSDMINLSNVSSVSPEVLSHSDNKFNIGSKNTETINSSTKSQNCVEINNEDPSVLTNNSNNATKRRLYSSENSNTRDLILSSQENISLEVPAYKLQKRDFRITPKRNVNRKHITYSYISHCEKENKSSPLKETTFSDVTKHNQDLEKPTDDSKSQSTEVVETGCKYFSGDQRKTPRFIRNNDKITPVNTIYSEFSSAGQDMPVKRTYARQKQVKGKKRVKVRCLISSDSESDYVPPTKLPKSPNTREVSRRTKKLETNVALDKFVNRLPSNVVDPIRDVVVTDKMEVETVCLNEPEIEPRQIEVNMTSIKIPSAVSVKIPKEKKSKVEKNKKPLKSIKAVDQAKKGSCKKKNKDGKKLDHMDEGRLALVPIDDDILEAGNQVEGNELTLEISVNPEYQDIDLAQRTFQLKDMVQFGKCCLVHVNENLQKVQSLAREEREMNLSTLNFQFESSRTAISTQCQKMEIVANNLVKIKSLMDTTLSLQRDISLNIQSEMDQLDEAKQELMKNTSKVEKSESSQLLKIFHSSGRFLKNLAFSFLPGNTTKKALENC